MKIPLLIASGDLVMFLFIGGVLILAGTAIGLGATGLVLLLGKTDEKKKRGKRLLVAASITLAAAILLWLLFTGLN